MITSEELNGLQGRKVLDAQGKTIGKVKDTFEIATTTTTDWLSVQGGMLGRTINFVPVLGASDEGTHVKLDYPRATIRKAPAVTDDQALTADDQTALRAHYGITEEDRGHGMSDRRDGGTTQAEEDAERIDKRNAAVALPRPEDNLQNAEGSPLRKG